MRRILLVILTNLTEGCSLYGVTTTYKTNNQEETVTGFKIHTWLHQGIPANILSKYVEP